MEKLLLENDMFAFFHAYDETSQRLSLRGATHIPPEIFDFAQKHPVKILDASDGALETLPDDFTRLNDLEIVFFSNNAFRTYPSILARCPKLWMAAFKSCGMTSIPEDALSPHLRWLVLTGNALTALPRSIGLLTGLQKCALAGNKLSALPDEMRDCVNLELLRISANDFRDAPPAWLFSLPKLAWYSDAGNPFSAQPPAQGIETLAWDQLTRDKKIGESPSSEVFSGSDARARQLAIKLFKGDLTSDGYPADDMRAALAAGSHDNLMQILARVTDAPDKRDGLALALLPPSYTRVGLPPNFDTVTRDSFPADTRFSAAYIQNVLAGIAAACAHIHSRTLMHGDIYAHNMMADVRGHALLGDFGAASFYTRADTARERIDVRAFGCLIDDMLQYSDLRLPQLERLRDSCLQETPLERPLFKAIAQSLRAHAPGPQLTAARA